MGGLAGNGDPDMGMELNKVLQVRQQNIFAEGRADADAQMANAQFPAKAQLGLRSLQCLKGRADRLEEQFAVFRELNASGVAGKERGAHGLLQLFDGFADGRLTDKKFLCSLGNVAGEGGCIENTVKCEVLIHKNLLITCGYIKYS